MYVYVYVYVCIYIYIYIHVCDCFNTWSYLCIGIRCASFLCAGQLYAFVRHPSVVHHGLHRAAGAHSNPTWNALKMFCLYRYCCYSSGYVSSKLVLMYGGRLTPYMFDFLYWHIVVLMLSYYLFCLRNGWLWNTSFP